MMTERGKCIQRVLASIQKRRDAVLKDELGTLEAWLDDLENDELWDAYMEVTIFRERLDRQVAVIDHLLAVELFDNENEDNE